MIKGLKKYARDTEKYSIRPQQKAKMWAEIIEAAKVVIEKGGGNIKFVPGNREDDEQEEL